MFTESESRLLRTHLPATGQAPSHPRLLAWLDEVVAAASAIRLSVTLMAA